MNTLERKRVLLLASLGSGSGNAATASRIANGLRQSSSMIVDCISVDTLQTEFHSLTGLIYQYHIVVALHIYRAGHFLTSIYEHQSDLPPLILIFAGTDLHCCESQWLPTINQILPKARAVVCFSNEWKEYVDNTYKDLLSCRITVIPQGVLLCPSRRSFSFCQKTILWAGQIRSVKDPLFAVRIMPYLTNDDFVLMIVGYDTDRCLFETLQSLCSEHSNIKLIGGQSTDDVHALMRTAFAYLNTSINEGMCLAILEAMALRLPIVARRNTGNISIINHEKTGLLYDTPEQAAQCILQLNNNKQFREILIEQAVKQIETVHNPKSEIKSYENLIFSLLH